jgi:ketosteroid isomerase-like protein
MTEQDNVALVRRGFEAFNQADVATLSSIIADDAVQHMPGANRFAGDHRGQDDILGMYGQMGELSNGTFGADLEDLTAEGPDRVIARYASRGQRNGKTLSGSHRLAFTIKGGLIVDMVDTPDDLGTWDQFWA